MLLVVVSFVSYFYDKSYVIMTMVIDGVKRHFSNLSAIHERLSFVHSVHYNYD